MAQLSQDTNAVNARIVYWGIDGAGKRTSLAQVARKLRPDHRGSMRSVPTRIDPTAFYTVLPIELGEIGGIRTCIDIVALPGSADQAPTRKQLIDQADGIVLVVDSQRDRIEENVACVEELRKVLHEYARTLEEIPVVVQYNKRDLSDDYVIDELHRRLGLGDSSVFEANAVEGTGILQTLSTISKKVIRTLRGQSLGAGIATPPAPAPVAAPAAAPEPIAPPQRAPVTPPPGTSQLMERAILAEPEPVDAAAIDAQVESTEALLEQPWHHEPDEMPPPSGARIGPDLSIVSVGEATRADDRTLRVPIVLGDGEGETSTLVLTLRLDPLLTGDG
jgi:signal recognition particle receptor subunit beta